MKLSKLTRVTCIEDAADVDGLGVASGDQIYVRDLRAAFQLVEGCDLVHDDDYILKTNRRGCYWVDLRVSGRGLRPVYHLDTVHRVVSLGYSIQRALQWPQVYVAIDQVLETQKTVVLRFGKDTEWAVIPVPRSRVRPVQILYKRSEHHAVEEYDPKHGWRLTKLDLPSLELLVAEDDVARDDVEGVRDARGVVVPDGGRRRKSIRDLVSRKKLSELL